MEAQIGGLTLNRGVTELRLAFYTRRQFSNKTFTSMVEGIGEENFEDKAL